MNGYSLPAQRYGTIVTDENIRDMKAAKAVLDMNHFAFLATLGSIDKHRLTRDQASFIANLPSFEYFDDNESISTYRIKNFNAQSYGSLLDAKVLEQALLYIGMNIAILVPGIALKVDAFSGSIEELWRNTILGENDKGTLRPIPSERFSQRVRKLLTAFILFDENVDKGGMRVADVLASCASLKTGASEFILKDFNVVWEEYVSCLVSSLGEEESVVLDKVYTFVDSVI